LEICPDWDFSQLCIIYLIESNFILKRYCIFLYSSLDGIHFDIKNFGPGPNEHFKNPVGNESMEDFVSLISAYFKQSLFCFEIDATCSQIQMGKNLD